MRRSGFGYEGWTAGMNASPERRSDLGRTGAEEKLRLEPDRRSEEAVILPHSLDAFSAGDTIKMVSLKEDEIQRDARTPPHQILVRGFNFFIPLEKSLDILPLGHGVSKWYT